MPSAPGAQAMIDALGWALVHFLWQGFAFALLFAFLTSPRWVAKASTRHALGVATLLAAAIAPFATFWVRLADAPVAGVSPALIGAQPGPGFWLGAGVEAVLPVVVGLWAAGVAVLTARLVLGWFGCRRLARRLTRPVEQRLDAVVASLAERLSLSRPVRVFASMRVSVPTVIGWLRPVVLLPAGAATRMSVEQLEMVLAHELAHVRRCDWLINLAQRVVETLLFYHPAVRWMSRRIREERELACDDIAVELTGRPVAYARALADLETLRDVRPGLALAATGGDLRHRVERIIGQDTQRADGAFVHFTVLATLTAALTFGAADMAPLDDGLRESARDCPASRARERAIGARAHAALLPEPGIGAMPAADIVAPQFAAADRNRASAGPVDGAEDVAVDSTSDGTANGPDAVERADAWPAPATRTKLVAATAAPRPMAGKRLAASAQPLATPARPDVEDLADSIADAVASVAVEAADESAAIDSPGGFAMDVPEAPAPDRLLASAAAPPPGLPAALRAFDASERAAWLTGGEGDPDEEEYTIVPSHMVAPDYPFRARRAGTQGFVKLSFSVDPDGRVSDIEVVDSMPRRVFDRVASDALREWRFEVDERLTENLRMVQTFDFMLEDVESMTLLERQRCRGSVMRTVCDTKMRTTGVAYVSPPRRLHPRGTEIRRQN